MPSTRTRSTASPAASGPRDHGRSLPANDHLMQALTGVEGSQGSPGQPPTFLVWGAIDVTSGWVSACAVIAALYARRRTGAGQSVSTSLLGSGMLLKSGAFLAGETRVGGPVLDADQTGYGATYRIYQARDGAWLAVVVPDGPTWARLRAVVQAEGLPDAPPPLRLQAGERQPAEVLLEEAFRANEREGLGTRAVGGRGAGRARRRGGPGRIRLHTARRPRRAPARASRQLRLGAEGASGAAGIPPQARPGSASGRTVVRSLAWASTRPMCFSGWVWTTTSSPP